MSSHGPADVGEPNIPTTEAGASPMAAELSKAGRG